MEVAGNRGDERVGVSMCSEVEEAADREGGEGVDK